MLRRPPRSTLFPSRRSSDLLVEIPEDVKDIRVALEDDLIRVGFRYGEGEWNCIVSLEFRAWLVANKPNTIRSEEHTSELQSRQYLVCRLLLEKKNTQCNEHQ